MIRFLLMLLLPLPGAEFAASNIDEVESFTATTLGAQFSMAVTPKTTLQKPLPASHGPINQGAMHNPPHPKDSKNQPGLLKDSPVKPVRLQPVQGGPQISDTNTTLYQQRTSTTYGTKMPMTAKSHLLRESTLGRPVIRKGPTATSKAKMVIKPNASSRYKSLPHLHHKNVTSKPETVQLKDSNVTTGLKPQRTVTTPLRNTFKPGQKGSSFLSDKVKHLPVGLQRVTQLGEQLKEKTSNTSQLLNTLINQNSSFTNTIQHMAKSLNSTFTTDQEAVPHEQKSLHSEDHLHNFENVTTVPNVERHNDVSRSRLFGAVHLPVKHDSRVMQELKSKVKVRIPGRHMSYNHTNLNFSDAIFSTDQPGLDQEEKGHLRPDVTTQVSVGGTTQLDRSDTWTERTSDKLTYPNSYSHGHMEGEPELSTHVMTREGTHLHKEKKQTRVAIAASQHTARNQTHSHKHRHAVQDQLNQESNTISQHNATLFDRTGSSEPHKHHPKNLLNHTHTHSHSHHKHRSDHHTQRNHISQTPTHLNIQEQSDVATEIQQSLSSLQQLRTEFVTSIQKKTSDSATEIQPSQSSPSQFYTDSIKPIQMKSSMQNNTDSNPELSSPSFNLEALKNQPYTQNALDSQSEQTTQATELTALYRVSIMDDPIAIHKSNMEQGNQSEVYQSPHTEPISHEQSKSHAKYNLTQTGHSITTSFKHILTTQPQLALTTHNPKSQSEMHPAHEELTTPKQKQQTIKNQLDLVYQSLPTLTTPTKPGLTFQTQPEIITQTLQNLGKGTKSKTPSERYPQEEQDLFTRGRSEGSAHRLHNLTTNPHVSLTVTLPFLVTQSQSEFTTERPPGSIKLVYFNTTQTESFIESFNGSRPYTEPITDRMEESTYTEQTTNSPTYSSTKPELQENGTIESTKQTEEMINSETKYSTHGEPILKHRSDTTTQMEPVTESRTESFTLKPTASDSARITEAITKSEATTKSMNESTAQTQPVIEEIDTPNPTPATTKGPTESSTQTETITRHIIRFTTNTEWVTRHETESDRQKNTPVANNTESITQTSAIIHSGGKLGTTSQRELILKIPLEPTIFYHHETTTRKEPTQSIEPDSGTPTYPQQSTWTMPELIKTVDEDQATEMYTPTERSLTPQSTSTTGEHRTAWSSGYTQNGSDNSRTIPAWGVEVIHPTSILPSGKHHSGDPVTTVKIYRSKAPSSSKSVTSPPSTTSNLQTMGEFMSVQPRRDRIFIVEEQQPIFKVPAINVTHRVAATRAVTCDRPDKCTNRFIEEVTSAYAAAPGFDRIDILNVTLAGGALEYKVLFGVRVGRPMSLEQERVLTSPTSLFKSLPPSDISLLSAIHNASLAAGPADPCTDWFSCPRGFHCVPQRQLSARCLSPCHSAFCQNDGICIHRKGQDPVCQCPVGTDFWYMGPTCDYRMTHHRLAAIACAVVFCIIICAAATVFFLVRRFQTRILQQKVAQTQSSYRRFSRFDDVPTHFWCPSQTWLTTSASLNSLDNPAFSSSEEVFPLQALGSCVCGCQNGARSNAPTIPPEEPATGPPRLETSCSSVNDLMIDSGKASDVSVCSWPMEPIHWTPFPILHQLSLQSPFHTRRPHSYFEGMELVNTERSWTA